MRLGFPRVIGLVACTGLLSLNACENLTSVGGGSGAGGAGGNDNGAGGSVVSIGSGGQGGGGSDPQACQSQVDKVDLLFVVDNSRSMADKQQVLSLALADLIQSLTTPPCLDANGVPIQNQPPSGLDACPQGSHREYVPVRDIHIGVISSSIGGHGADSCPDQELNSCAPNVNTTGNDKGHLLDREDACNGGTVPTYQGFGFLNWDPEQTSTPPGSNDVSTFIDQFKDIVAGVGQIGCGYESQMESWYRFLVDPEPYNSIEIVDGAAHPQGIDTQLLEQRKRFLRPDSLLGVVVLSDENDCSIKEFGQFYYAGQLRDGNGTPFHMPRPRSECAQNPADPCCASCGMATPAGCPADPTCLDVNGNLKTLTDLEDASNLRCFDQKRRFGIDFLYPTERYADALTSPMIANRNGDLVQNPLFSDLDPSDGNSPSRDPGLVVFTTIVGVPWQDVAIGGDAANGFKPSSQIDWSALLGQPGTPPTNPYMVESIDPRPGIANPNPINGHEYANPYQDDLQYACVFDLAQPRDCSDPSIVSCDCTNPANDNPLCAPAPGGGNTLQVKAKAYPSLRQLEVAKQTGGVVTSICPPQLDNPAEADFGYRPAIRTLIDRMKPCLLPATGL